MTDNLPPLPEPEAWRTQVGPWGDISTDYAYTLNQMRAYAAAAVAERDAEIERLKDAARINLENYEFQRDKADIGRSMK